MKKTLAWMLRQDGTAFGVGQHIYVMNTEDFSSEADAAAFILKTNSGDVNYAKYVLDAWMGKLIEQSVSYDADETEINGAISDALNKLPYHFTTPINTNELLEIHDEQRNFFNIDTLYDFMDEVAIHQDEISENIKTSLNQQFCRVRFGGRYRTEGTATIWFRISSTGFNWANTIYEFTAKMKSSLGITNISICRDYESDFGEDEGHEEYFYRAKDGTVYFNLPIDEYFEEEHEHSPVFSTRQIGSGVLSYIRSCLSHGMTHLEILADLEDQGLEPPYNYNKYLIRGEQKKCIDCSYFLDHAPTRTRNKIAGIVRDIKREYPEITAIDTDVRPYPNRKGNMVGLDYVFTIESPVEKLDHLEIHVPFTRGDATPDMIVRGFRREYDDWIEFNNIRI